MFFFLVVGVVAVGLAATFVLQSKQKRIREDTLKSLASRFRLDLEPGYGTEGRVTGTIEGVRVSIFAVSRGSGKSETTWMRIQARPTVPLPEGLSVGPEGLDTKLAKFVGMQDIEVNDAELDSAAWIQAKRPLHVQQVFESPRLRLACTLLLGESSQDGLRDGTLAMETQACDAEVICSLIPRVLEAAHAFEDAQLYPWHDLAANEALTLEVDGRHVRAFAVAGDGTRADIRGSLVTGQTVIQVTVPCPLPSGLRIVSGHHAGALALGDPILDGRVTATGDSADRVRALVCSDKVRGELLAVLHAFPGSEVQGQVVKVTATAASSRALDSCFNDAVALADALSERARELA